MWWAGTCPGVMLNVHGLIGPCSGPSVISVPDLLEAGSDCYVSATHYILYYWQHGIHKWSHADIVSACIRVFISR
jgi:hypothetical protein